MVFISTEKQMKYVALLILILINFDASAADCVTYRGEYYHETYQAQLKYYTFHGSALETCNDFILMTGLEYATLSANADSLNFLNSVTATLTELFEFSAEDFGLINSLFIVAFITGHVLGRVSRLLGKTS